MSRAELTLAWIRRYPVHPVLNSIVDPMHEKQVNTDENKITLPGLCTRVARS